MTHAHDPAARHDALPKRRKPFRREHRVASLDSLRQRAQERSRTTGESLDEAAAVVVEDLESAVNALNTRVSPLLRGTSFLVAVASLMFKVEPSSQGLAEFLIGLSVILAITGTYYLVDGVSTYAGRRAIGLMPTVEDVAFTRARLVRKYNSAYRGGWLAGISLTCLVIGILLGVHLGISLG